LTAVIRAGADPPVGSLSESASETLEQAGELLVEVDVQQPRTLRSFHFAREREDERQVWPAPGMGFRETTLRRRPDVPHLP
jgi:hypothetical protein